MEELFKEVQAHIATLHDVVNRITAEGVDADPSTGVPHKAADIRKQLHGLNLWIRDLCESASMKAGEA